jgi:hypothetical protein
VRPVALIDALEFLTVGGTVTFGALGLYEKQYRPKIEQGRYILADYVKTQATDMLASIKLPMTPETLQLRVNRLIELNSLSRRPEDLLSWRRYLIGIFVVLAFFALIDSFMPDYVFGNLPVGVWTFVVLVLLVVINGVFLWICTTIDRLIAKVDHEQKPKHALVA